MLNKTSAMKVALIGLTGAFISFGQANAAPVVINAFDHGWYSQIGSHSPSNTNIWTGAQGTIEGNNTNHFVVFDLGAVTGMTITSASISYDAGNGSYNSSDASETVNWYDYTGDTDDLLASSSPSPAGVARYTDLGDGAVYGSAVVSGPPSFSPGTGSPMPAVTAALTAAALADINATLLNSDQRFVVGASVITSVFGLQQKLWWGSFTFPSVQLTLNAEPLPAPLPGALALLGVGLFGLAFRRTRQV